MATITDNFTPLQQRVLSLLAAGSTITGAARACDLDRTTIYHWRRTSPEFALAADEASAEAVDAYRIAAQAHADAALKALRQILDNPDAPASVRCKAALFILNAVKPDTHAVGAVSSKVSNPRPNSTQFNTFRPVSAVVATAAPAPTTPATPQVGRNSPCPCQSGRKYKQCCLNNNQGKAQSATAAA